MKPEDLTIEALEAAVGVEPAQWEGNCSVLAHAAVRLVGGRYAYGHYYGPVNPEGFWKEKLGPFQRHAWVVLDDLSVLDPTRWSFTATEPAIFITADSSIIAQYDEGGQAMRRALRQPPPADDASDDFASIEGMSADCRAHLCGMMGRPLLDRINYGQAVWLASAPLSDLCGHSHEFYMFLLGQGWDSVIPIDHLRMVMG